MMTARFPVLILLLFAPLGARATEAPLSYRIDGADTAFVRLEQEELLITKSCATSECSAKKALKRASTIGVEVSGGANPGARICRKIGGEVVIGLDRKGNELSFCRFEDGSMVSSGSVHSRAIRNDLAK